MPDQVMPLQVMPDHVMPDQVMPDHVMPLQVMPDQVMPFQFAPLRRPAAQVRTSNDLPRTSISPDTTRPLTVTWTEPREASREPIPVETAKLCFALTGVAVSLALREVECAGALLGRGGPGIACADPVSSALTWSGVMSGRCWISRAAAPETTAADCEVPLPRKSRSPMRAAG